MPLRWAPAGRLIGWEGQEAARRLGCTKLRIKPHPSRLSEMVSAIGRHYQLAEVFADAQREVFAGLTAWFKDGLQLEPS